MPAFFAPENSSGVLLIIVPASINPRCLSSKSLLIASLFLAYRFVSLILPLKSGIVSSATCSFVRVPLPGLNGVTPPDNTNLPPAREVLTNWGVVTFCFVSANRDALNASNLELAFTSFCAACKTNACCSGVSILLCFCCCAFLFSYNKIGLSLSGLPRI